MAKMTLPDIAAKIPVGTFIDYGEPLTDDPSALNWFRNYVPARTRGTHIVIRPGERIPFQGIDADIVSAAGALITTPLRGGGAGVGAANAACRELEDFPEDGTENYGSIGVLLTYGAFRFLDLGDLSRNTLTRLACPANLLGRVSAYLVSHHGDYDTNVPVLFAGPPFRPGRYGEFARVVDMAPTLAAALGVAPAEPLDGVVLRSALRRPPAER